MRLSKRPIHKRPEFQIKDLTGCVRQMAHVLEKAGHEIIYADNQGATIVVAGDQDPMELYDILSGAEIDDLMITVQFKFNHEPHHTISTSTRITKYSGNGT